MSAEVGDAEKKEIMAWAKTRPECKPHLDNWVLVLRQYRRNHPVSKVEQVMDGAKAELTLYIEEVTDTKGYKGCKVCYGKECSDKCGEERYGDLTGLEYTGMDTTYKGDDISAGTIKVNVAPWNMKKVPALKVDTTYKIKGGIRVNKGKRGQEYTRLDLVSANDLQEVIFDAGDAPAREADSQELDTIVKMLRHTFKMVPKIEDSNYQEIVGEYDNALVAEAENVLNIKKDGEFMVISDE